MTAKLDAKRILMVLLLLALGALAACGGGGDDEDDLNPNLPTPSITGLSVNVANIGDPLEIYGSNFGDAQSGGKASCNGTDFVVTAWTDTKLTTTVPVGMTSGIVVVSQNGKSSTSGSEAQLFIGSMPEGAPLISAINPNYGQTGAEILITGRNFGTSATAGTVYFQPNLAVSQGTPVAAEVVTVEVGGVAKPQWTATSIKVKVPGPALAAGESRIYVQVAGEQSNTRVFTKLPDAITGDTHLSGIEPADGPVGTLVTVTGDGLGFSQGSSTISISGIPLEVIEWTNTEIRANIPAGAVTGAVRVMVNGTPYDSPPFTVGNSPVISGVSPASIRIGKSLTIYGEYFGVDPGTGSLKVGSTTVAVDDTNWSNGQIYVPKLPKIATADPEHVPVVVTADNGLQCEPFYVSISSDLTILSTVDPSAGEAGTTLFTFTVVASGGSGVYSYELIPDANAPSVVAGPFSTPSLTYTYPSSVTTTKSFSTLIRVTDTVSGDSNTAAGPTVLVVAPGSPVIVNMAVQDFNRGGVNAPNDWVLHPFTQGYNDFSFNGSNIYFTSENGTVEAGGNPLPAFVRDESAFMNDGGSHVGTTPRPYGYRYGTAAAPSTGSSVRVMGLNFGTTPGQVYLNSTLDNNGQPSGGVLLAPANVIEWANNYVVIRMPQSVNQSLSGYIVLQTSDNKYAKSATPLIASPYVTAISPTNWSPGGTDTLQIAGFDFQPPQIGGVTGAGVYLFWMVWAQYNDPFAGGAQVTRQVMRIEPVAPSNIEGNTIFFPTSALAGDVLVEVTNPARTASQIVTGTLTDGEYSFWIWTGALTTGSAAQIANSGIFSAAYSFERGAGGPGPGTFKITGKIRDGLGLPPNDGAAGVTVSLTGASTASVVTAADGTYTFSGLSDGNYTVTPSGGGFDMFNPASLNINIAGADVAATEIVAVTFPGP